MAEDTLLSEETFGVIGTFHSAPDIYEACKKTHKAGFTKWDSYTPYPVHGLDKASGQKRSMVGAFSLVGGVTGFTVANIMVWFMNAFDYPLIVGGKPFYSPIFPFPIAYEMTILFAAFGTLFGMFALNRLPQHHNPLFNYKEFYKCTDDTFAICIEAKDPKFDARETTKFLEDLGAQNIKLIPIL
ncbi:MAG: DUF3341 domain-containing protein [Opitutales bacterium]